MTDERRQHPRQAMGMAVRFKVDSIDQFVDSFAEDISVGGLQLRTSRPLEKGDKLYVEFRMGEAKPVIASFVHVRWCAQDTVDIDYWNVGVEFEDLDESSADFIRHALDYHEERRRYRRVPTKYRVVIRTGSLKEFAESYATDISAGGMKLKLDSRLSEDDTVVVDFRVDDQTLFAATSHIRWCKPIGNAFEAGVEFDELDDTAHNFIHSLIKDSSGN